MEEGKFILFKLHKVLAIAQKKNLHPNIKNKLMKEWSRLLTILYRIDRREYSEEEEYMLANHYLPLLEYIESLIL